MHNINENNTMEREKEMEMNTEKCRKGSFSFSSRFIILWFSYDHLDLW